MTTKKKIALDDIDYKILKELSMDSEKGVKEIAEKIGIPVSTCFNRIKKLKELGVIKRFTINVDPSIIGYDVTAAIHLNVEGPYLEEIEKTLAENPNILYLYDITGEYDVLAIARFRSVEELDKFIKSLLKNPKIKRTITNVILRVVKESDVKVPL
ncbi:MAG: winged helix-turn-helix transcriptional regulator [Desulfurococcales archaeon]|jgi:DNA-binding Lrp family transcriptional regulator|nr:winged helix-turn-helix transcriptional regulator [Desulfurococcales archaeon]